MRGICLTLGNCRLEVTSSSADYGEAKEVIETACDQEALRIGFNADYVLDFLGAVTSATAIRVELKDAQIAAQFRFAGDQFEGYKYVLMPLRL
jgi:DNA polymerase III subunit beta